jgi:SAM-dependent methyltransferase
MDGSYPGKLRVWEGWAPAALQDPPGPGTEGALPDVLGMADAADRLFASEALTAPVGPRTEDGAEPYTLQWFLSIESQRHNSREGRWIPRLLEFAKHRGETLLGLGDGLGTDWLQYARHGAAVIVCSPVAQQLALARRNFELRGLSGRFLHAAATNLPLESASIDVVCVSGLLHATDDPGRVIDEVYRVLKPGGKVLAVTPARRNVDYWKGVCLPWRRWWGGPGVNARPAGFTARGLKRLFGRFIEFRIHKRQLRRRELPHVWRWVPLPVMERLMGRTLVLKAFKPLSAAMSLQAAA